ncbi:endo-1,4-beta-xylanase [Streptomyces monticola]|uniref:Endo-1,4-beta-xylanase n=1 Tax=Streptomyces monticola TaxID=2666263 RepID=A0ABW2JS31_9ACTN
MRSCPVAVAVDLTSRAVAATALCAAARSGRYVGAAVLAVPGRRLGDAPYSGVLDREFTMVIPENKVRTDVTEPSHSTFTFGSAQLVVSTTRSPAMPTVTANSCATTRCYGTTSCPAGPAASAPRTRRQRGAC